MARQINATYRMNFVIICCIIPIVLFCSYQIISQSEQNEIVHETVLKHTNITNVTSANHIRYIDKDVVNVNININNEDEDEDNDDADGASRIRKTDVFHFCGNSRVQVMVASADSDNDADDDMIPNTDKTSLSLLYQCSGEPYEQFANILHSFAYNRSITSSYEKKKENDEDGNYNYNNSSSAHNNSIYWKHKEGDQCSALVLSHSNNNILWGQREFPFDDNMTILAIGNSHLRQISKTIACQYAHKIKSIHFLPSIRDSATDDDDDDDDDNNNNNIESFVLEFSNNARWISVTNQVVLYSEEWKELLEEFYLNSLHPPPSSSSSSSSSSFFTSGRSTERGGLLLKDIDAIIFGKFTTYKQAKGTNFERTMNDEELAYYDYRKRHDKIQQQQQHVELNYPNRTLLRKKGGNKGTRTTSTHQTTTLTSTPIVNFTYILPPDIVGIAKIYNGPIISVSMFSKSYTLDTQSSYDTYRQQCLLLAEKKEDDSNNTTGNSTCIDNAADGNINKNLYLIDSRRYIVEMGIECGTDDKKTIGTCHEPLPIKSLEDRGNQTNSTTIQRYRDPSDMHRCAGARGGHTDLVAWDVIESLYDTRLKNA